MGPAPSAPVVLLIEDDDVDRERAQRMLARSVPETTVVPATSGAEGLAVLSSRHVDVVLLDFYLHDLTAVELLPAIRRGPSADCRVIVLTGHGNEELAVWAMQHGADDYLDKYTLTAARLGASVLTSVERPRPAAHATVGPPEWFRPAPDEVQILLTGAGRITAASESVGPLLGWARHELLGRHLGDLLHPDDPSPLVLPATTRTLHRLRHYTGAWCWFESTTRLVGDEGGGRRGVHLVSRDVTRRIENERELAESEARYRRLADLAGQALLAHDEHGVITFANPALGTLLGRSPTSIVGTSIDLLQRHRTGDRPQRSDPHMVGQVYETRLRHSDGHDVWVEVNVARVFESGRVTGTVALFTDISARRSAEETLASAEQRHHLQLELSPIGMFQQDERGHLLYVNRRWREIAGLPIDLDTAPEWTDVIHPDDLPAARRQWRHCIEEGSIFDARIRLERPDCEVRWVAVRCVTVMLLDGSTCRLGTMEDVTDRTRAEEALRRSEELYRSVIEAMTEGVNIEAADGHLIGTNPAASRILGTASGDLRELVLLREDGSVLPPHESPGGLALRTGDPTGDRIVGVRHPARGLRWLTASAQPLRRDPDSRPWAAVCTFADVTDRREIERMKAEFVSVVSHEMRTPLTSIRAALGLLAGGASGPLSEAAQRMADIANQNTERLAELVDDILDVERLHAGHIDLVLGDHRIDDLVDEAVSGIGPMADRNAVTLEVAHSGVSARVDGRRVVQVMTNLLANAVKFSEADTTVTISSHVGLRADSPEVLTVVVVDHGRGVPPERANDIFERFQQVDASDSRDKGGTGLGLTICKSIVVAHAGSIWVETTPGGGATFVFTLPLAPLDGGPS